MIWVLAVVLLGYLLLDRRRLRRERDQLQLMWLQEALLRREEMAAAQDAIAQLLEDQYGAERMADGRILLPPMSLN